MSGAVACAQCGEPMECRPEGACWCMERTVIRLPNPSNPGCICPRCFDAACRELGLPDDRTDKPAG